MKHLLLIAVLILLSLQLGAQHQITKLQVIPQNPTADDSITVIVDLQFASGPCTKDVSQLQQNGNRITTLSHYCVGALTVICPAADTFPIGQLPNGSYTLHSTLTAGALPLPCTPGITTNDMDSLMFTVGKSSDIMEVNQQAVKLKVLADGRSMKIEVDEKWIGLSMRIYSLGGALVMQKTIASQIELIDLNLSNGLYLVRVQKGGQSHTSKIVINN